MKTITSCLLVCSLALLSACGGDSNSSIKKSGVVILDEAPVVRALICIDADRNLSCDDGEPSAITDDGGAFQLRFPRRYSDRDFVVDGFADEEAEVAFASRATKSTTDPVRFFLTANQSSKTVSPLTTLVAVRARLMGGTAEALAFAQAEVVAMLGLPADTDLNNFDYVAQNNVKVRAISAAIADVFAASREAILSQDPGANPVAVLALSVSDLFTTPEGGQSRLASIASAINDAPEGTDLESLVSELVLNNTIPADDVQGKLQDVETRIGLIDGRYLPIEDGSIVRDVVTGLEWQRCSVGQTWNAQTSTCDGDAVRGRPNDEPTAAGGFVLPTIEQLRTLVYCSDTGNYDSDGNNNACGAGAQQPALNLEAFHLPQDSSLSWARFWSASPYDDDDFWFVSFQYGVATKRDEIEEFYYRLVRSGQSINQYTLTFDSAGGSAVTPIALDFAAAITASADPTRAGYIFAGWNPPVPATMPALNQTLIAQWTVPLHALSFDSAGGSAIAPIAQQAGTAVTAPAAPTRVGYTFAGWSPALSETMPGENLAFTAQWTINQYTLTFDSAGGSAVDPIAQNFATAVTAPAAPTRVGYTFAGWSPAVPETMPAENLAFTAQWIPMQYSLAYAAAAGGSLSGNPEQTVSHGQSGSEVIAVANFGYSFQQWTDGGASASRTDTNVTAAATYTANFVLNAAGPAGVVAVAGDESVTVSWAPVAGASSYNLYRSQDTGFDVANYAASTGGTLVVGVTSPYQVTSLANGTAYYFRVTAVSASGEGLPSVQVAATPEAAVNEGLTRVCVNGEAEGEGSCPADPMVGSSNADWGCTRDGATGLMWAVNSFNNVFFGEGSTDDRYFWFNDGTGAIPNGGVEGYSGDTASCNNVYFWMYDLCNSQNYTSYVNTNGGVCGSTQWRLPTRAELLTLWGESDPLSFTIDDNYFPNFVNSWYLTSETNAGNADEFWTVELELGQTQTESKAFPGAPQRIWLVSDPAP